MDANELYLLESFILNKNQHGYFSPNEFRSVNSMAQRSWLAFMLGGFQSYTPGRPISRVELGQNAVIRERLAPVIVETTLTVAAGLSSYPADYLQTDAMWDSATTLNRIRLIQQEKLFSVANSVIDPVADFPIYKITDTGFRFYPSTVTSAQLSYVKNPPDIIWGSIPDGNGVPQYDAGSSTAPVFDDTCVLEIAVRALRMMGVNLEFGVVSQYAQEIKMQGQ